MRPAALSHRRSRRHALARALALAGLLLGCSGSPKAAPELAALRVGTSGDYAPFSTIDADGRFHGFDVEIAEAYARDRGLRISWVRFRWPELTRDLEAKRFDVAMSGITVRPERSLAGSFSVPVLNSGAVVLVRASAGVGDVAELQRPGLTMAVNAGGHLERVARRLFPAAQLAPIADNPAVRQALLDERVEAAVTDTLEAPHWLRGTRNLQALGPLTRDRKAYLVQRERRELSRDLDDWLLAREADGTLAGLRLQTLSRAAAPGPADPALALLAAVDERLDLMPWVAEGKRRSNSPIRVPEREAQVIAAGVAAASRAAQRAGRAPLPESAVADFYRLLIGAARQVQEQHLAGSASATPPPDLVTEIRPALLRIGERIAALLVRLPRGLDPESTAEEALLQLDTPGLSDASKRKIGLALARLRPRSG
jgi:cyclohexadienyl dehydratase